MTKDILDVYELPGLQSVAIARLTPASSSGRASGYFVRVENSAPGRKVPTVVDAASNEMSACE
jgi:hypothetical protein